MKIATLASHGGNFRIGRNGKKILYIVIHYTANDADTARGNAAYFARTKLGSSAHFFVDEREVFQSVQEADTAWHCGAPAYKHPSCRNNNSLGVELCSRREAAGNYYFMPKTVENADKLVRELMEKWSVPPDHVLRHFDVTGKNCPAPFVESPAAWADFQKRLTEKSMTAQQAKEIIAQKAGLEPQSITFLEGYQYADDLLVKLAKAMG